MRVPVIEKVWEFIVGGREFLIAGETLVKAQDKLPSELFPHIQSITPSTHQLVTGWATRPDR